MMEKIIFHLIESLLATNLIRWKNLSVEYMYCQKPLKSSLFPNEQMFEYYKFFLMRYFINFQFFSI